MTEFVQVRFLHHPAGVYGPCFFLPRSRVGTYSDLCRTLSEVAGPPADGIYYHFHLYEAWLCPQGIPGDEGFNNDPSVMYAEAWEAGLHTWISQLYVHGVPHYIMRPHPDPRLRRQLEQCWYVHSRNADTDQWYGWMMQIQASRMAAWQEFRERDRLLADQEVLHAWSELLHGLRDDVKGGPRG